MTGRNFLSMEYRFISSSGLAMLGSTICGLGSLKISGTYHRHFFTFSWFIFERVRPSTIADCKARRKNCPHFRTYHSLVLFSSFSEPSLFVARPRSATKLLLETGKADMARFWEPQRYSYSLLAPIPLIIMLARPFRRRRHCPRLRP